MQKKDIVVIGTSAGGIDALKALVGGLPRDLQASVFVVLHVAPYSLGILPEILERAGPLPASNAKDWEQFERGRVYVAPPDYHLLVERTGHAYSADSLLAGLTEKTEESLWSAIRAFEENIFLLRHLAEHHHERRNDTDAEAFFKRADESQRRADLVRRAVMSHENLNRSKLALLTSSDFRSHDYR